VKETEIFSQIKDLVAEEHSLRQALQDGTVSAETEWARLRQLDEALDQCWDLLRQRRARRDAGEDPDAAEPRPVSEVEGYLQ
jgi:hypothetical protein